MAKSTEKSRKESRGEAVGEEIDKDRQVRHDIKNRAAEDGGASRSGAVERE